MRRRRPWLTSQPHSLTTPFGEKQDVYFKETTFLLFCQTVVNALAAAISEDTVVACAVRLSDAAHSQPCL